MWKIFNEELKAGEKKRLYVSLGEISYKVPVTLVCGEKPGKTVLVSSGIHSGEYPGIAAVINVADQIEPGKLRGNIIFMHCVNVSGFWARTVEIVPEDSFNLNRDYPGSPDGTVGGKIAYFFVKELFGKLDFIMDLHSGANTEKMAPMVFFIENEKLEKASFEAAKALNLEHLAQSYATSGQYSYAATEYGVPGILVEIGDSHSCRKEWVKMYEKNIKLLLNHLGAYDFDVSKDVTKQFVYRKVDYVNAEQRGLWYTDLVPGQKLKKGELIGEMRDFFGDPIREYRAEANGTILYFTDALAAPENSFLYALGREESSETLIE